MVRSEAKSGARNHRTRSAVAALLIGMLGFLAPLAGASAVTTAYEFEGEWVEQPEVVRSGIDVLGTEWWLDINDDAPAPTNLPVENNVVTIVLENALFTEIPTTCLTESPDATGAEVSPLSTVSDDGRTLTCNLGTRTEGTAERLFAGVLTDGPAGSFVGATGTFRQHTVELPKIPITNEFWMDAKFSGGAPQSYTGGPDPTSTSSYFPQYMNFPFSISHASNTPAGPATLTYELDIRHTSRSAPDPEVEIRGAGCVPNTRIQSGVPYSGDGFPAEQTADFPTCTIEKTGPTTFRLTLSDLDYSAGPALDSNGQPLPLAQDVIAAGMLELQVTYKQGGGRVLLAATETPYTAVDGQVSVGDASNNSNLVPVVRGGWTGGWIVGAQRPDAYPGSPWTDTSRAPAGATVMSVGAVKIPHQWNHIDHWLCKVLDTEHVVFQEARLAISAGAVPNLYYDESYTGDIWYYTGDFVDPVTGAPVDPNEFACGGQVDRMPVPVTGGNPEAGNPPGWSTTPPADLSTVRAVKVQVPKSLGGVATAPNGSVYLVIEQQIKPETPIGTDIWTWTQTLEEGNSNWAWTQQGQVAYDRTYDPAYVKSYGTTTPDLRYPYAGPGRDVLRVVGSEPIVEKTVARNEYAPGEIVDYELRYGLESNLAEPAPDTVLLVDTLPVGMTYVPGSADPEPAVTGDPVTTGQVLTWTFEGVVPNAEFGTVAFRAELSSDAAPGSVQVNEVSASSQGITRYAEAQFIVPNSGYTTLLKETETPWFELGDGTHENTWTLTLTSRDPNVSDRTDVIDILPFNGDERGTNFVGELELTEVAAPEGAVVYYSTADPATIDEDPAALTNGGFATPSDIWTTEFTEDATAIRVISGPLAHGETQEVVIGVRVVGAGDGNSYVNTAVARATSTQMRMRTSDLFTVGVEPTTPPTEEPTTPPTEEPTTPPTENPTTPPTEEPTTPPTEQPSTPSTTPPTEDPTTPAMPRTGVEGMAPILGTALVLLTAGGASLAAMRRRQH